MSGIWTAPRSPGLCVSTKARDSSVVKAPSGGTPKGKVSDKGLPPPKISLTQAKPTLISVFIIFINEDVGRRAKGSNSPLAASFAKSKGGKRCSLIPR